MVKGKAAAADLRIPQNREEVAAMIGAFGKAVREVELIETAMKESLAQVKANAEKDAAPHLAEAERLFKGLQLYCDTNRQTLLGNSGLKTAEFATGKVAWRSKPAKVTLTGEHVKIVDRIVAKANESLGRNDVASAQTYKNFLRVSTEIDKEAMLKNPALARTIEGVRVGSGGETFEVEPFGAQLAEAAQ
ncbi:host-nuclease inhibitor Gam family protein [Bradyrhizobium quebecense]|uniref:Host-nuclease inhibitor Gam family protein n=1 Tax=Bradyrhizobium quebecense TaxID=2748629 RepID=A0A973WSX2_9BRAD|nr:host-nuclease inhibitor Gam family protein [Bradyrhizobium quebecense]UGA45985.1 host-nuclease inhibitor Gam family protein [Bradyrhizobium quebecense]